MDDVSTTGATAYYAARHIASQGGLVVGVLQMGLTPNGEKASKFSQRQFIGNEATLKMSESTKNALLKKADEATRNAVLQYHGIAYHWNTLTDALGRALAADWRKASTLAGISDVGAINAKGNGERPLLGRDSGSFA